MKKISVVILNWNGEAMLRQFLPSVIAYSEAEGVEICVAAVSYTHLVIS